MKQRVLGLLIMPVFEVGLVCVRVFGSVIGSYEGWVFRRSGFHDRLA